MQEIKGIPRLKEGIRNGSTSFNNLERGNEFPKGILFESADFACRIQFEYEWYQKEKRWCIYFIRMFGLKAKHVSSTVVTSVIRKVRLNIGKKAFFYLSSINRFQ